MPKDVEQRLERVDKAVGALHVQIQEIASRKAPSVELPKDLELRLEEVEKAARAADMKLAEVLNRGLAKPQEKDDRLNVVEEIVYAVADLKDNVARLNARLMKIEEFLLELQTKGVAPKQRVLRRRL